LSIKNSLSLGGQVGAPALRDRRPRALLLPPVHPFVFFERQARSGWIYRPPPFLPEHPSRASIPTPSRDTTPCRMTGVTSHTRIPPPLACFHHASSTCIHPQTSIGKPFERLLGLLPDHMLLAFGMRGQVPPASFGRMRGDVSSRIGKDAGGTHPPVSWPRILDSHPCRASIVQDRGRRPCFSV